MGEGSKPVHLTMGRNPITITFIIDGTMNHSLIHSQFHYTISNVLHNYVFIEDCMSSWNMMRMVHMNIIKYKKKNI